MNQKHTLGAILGIVGIIYGTLRFLHMAGVALSKLDSIVPSAVGLIFFFAGINLVQATGDRT